MFVKAKKCHSYKKETWKLNCCHGNITISVPVCLSSRALLCKILVTMSVNISRDILDFMFCLRTVTTYDVNNSF